MTDLSGEDILKLQDELQLLRFENCRLKNATECVTEAGFQENDAKVKLYTGLPSFTTLMAVFACVSARVLTALQASLTTFQQFAMVLMKLLKVCTEFTMKKWLRRKSDCNCSSVQDNFVKSVCMYLCLPTTSVPTYK